MNVAIKALDYCLEYYQQLLWPDYTLKYIRISTDILWRVFCILTKPVPCTFVSINWRNNEARAHIAISVDIRIFLTVQTVSTSLWMNYFFLVLPVPVYWRKLEGTPGTDASSRTAMPLKLFHRTGEISTRLLRLRQPSSICTAIT